MKRFSTFVFTSSVLLILAFIVACGGSTAPSVPSAPTSAPARATSQPAPAGIVTATPESNSDAAPLSANTVAFPKINLNTATAEQILTIPNAGNRMVREFQEYRPYTSILQFRREIGKYVDAETVAGYEKYVYVPVDVNQSDAATLQQIPGVTAEIAAQLIAARPYGTNQNFLAKLVTLTTVSDVAMAQNYLATP
jgi:DNA uptake protein ComE-like DNA-binding protein